MLIHYYITSPSLLKQTFQNLLFQNQNHIEFAKANFLMFYPNLLLLNMTEFAKANFLMFYPNLLLLNMTKFAEANFYCSLPLAVSYSRPSSLKRTFQNLLFQNQNHIEFAKANFSMFASLSQSPIPHWVHQSELFNVLLPLLIHYYITSPSSLKRTF